MFKPGSLMWQLNNSTMKVDEKTQVNQVNITREC